MFDRRQFLGALALPAAAGAALEALRRTAAEGDNVMPALIDAAKANCSVGESVNALADVYGRFEGGVGW